MHVLGDENSFYIFTKFHSLISMNNEKHLDRLMLIYTQKIQTKRRGSMILWKANYAYPLSHRLEALLYTINFQETPYHTI